MHTTVTVHERTSLWGRLLHAVLAVAILAGIGSGEAGAEQSSRLTIPSSVGAPGKTVTHSIYLSGDADEKLAEVSLTIRFPSDQLSFEGATMSYPVERRGVQLSVSTEGSPDGKPKASIVLALLIPADTAEGLPHGPLAHLQLRILPEVLVGSKIEVEAEARGVTLDDPPMTVEPLPVQSGMIEVVSPEALFACFFYMH